MRTTLTLNDDVVHLLNQAMQQSGATLEETVNHFLRLGLMSPQPPEPKPFVVVPRRLGLPPGMSYDSVTGLLETLEGADSGESY
ncbi:MAG: hypothetical protein IT165_35185 [Bryobacterales bacterium]|nr:hypothetical protein [Bryobacterales bacterium]